MFHCLYSRPGYYYCWYITISINAIQTYNKLWLESLFRSGPYVLLCYWLISHWANIPYVPTSSRRQYDEKGQLAIWIYNSTYILYDFETIFNLSLAVLGIWSNIMNSSFDQNIEFLFFHNPLHDWYTTMCGSDIHLCLICVHTYNVFIY